MTWTIERAVAEFEAYRDGQRLRQLLFRKEDPSIFDEAQSVACALGAFLHADNMQDARQRGCDTHIMPHWLVEATPYIFDWPHYVTHNYHIRWADCVYGREGLVHRANRLPQELREQMWDQAFARLGQVAQEIDGCRQKQAKACLTGPNDSFNSYGNVGAWALSQSGYKGIRPEEAREQAATAILDAIDDALKHYGV